MIKFLIGGPPYGCQNIGDEGILTAIVGDIRSLTPDAHITVFTDNQDTTTAKLNVEPRPLYGWLNWLREMYKTDVFICGGATILSDCPRHALKLALIARMMGKPVMVYGVGMDPIRDARTRLFIRLVCNRVDLISVRDQDVKQRLIEYGVKPDKVFATADPAILLKPVASDGVASLLLRQGLKNQPRPWVGVGISGELDVRYITPCQTLAQALDLLVAEMGALVIFIPMNTRPDQDMPLMEKIRSLMTSRDRAYLLTGKYTPEEMLGIVEQMDLIISSRLHLLIFAAVANVPVVGLSRSAKIDSFLRRLGQESAGRVGEITAAGLVEKVRSIWENRVYIKSQLDNSVQEMKKLALENRRLLGELLVQHKLVNSQGG